MHQASKRAREIHLVSRPSGVPANDNFKLIEVDLPDRAEGQIQVKNLCMSLDPYMRPRMDLGDSYVAPFALNEALEAQAIGVVVASRHSAWQEGDVLSSFQGWRDYFVVDGNAEHPEVSEDASEFDLMRATLMRLPDTALDPALYLGPLGGVGLSAYVGLKGVGQMKGGQTVFITGAAGGVGHLAGQIAKIHGCRVIGSAGSDAKCEFLRNTCGFDDAFNYKTSDADAALSAFAPEGFDIFFDNVGGDITGTALNHMRRFGRVVVCGMIADYNTDDSPVLKNYFQLVASELTMRGFVATSLIEEFPEWISEMVSWLECGEIHFERTEYQGLESSVKAFQGLFQGDNTGKLLVRLAD